MTTHDKLGGSPILEQKWEQILDGVDDPYTRQVTAQLMENQAKEILNGSSELNELAVAGGTTTVGDLGTFQKFAFPLVRRVYPELIFNKIGAVQPMNGPVSQIFYLGNTRHFGATPETLYSKYKLTYKGNVTDPIGSTSGAAGIPEQGTWGSDPQGSGLDGTNAIGLNGASTFDVSNVLRDQDGSPSATFGGDIASWPNKQFTGGWHVSAGERLTGTGIPEVSFHIQQQPVVAKTRKMRALWTLEASQDLKVYHNIDLERELTELLSKEVALEIDRELIEDLRMIGYGFNSGGPTGWEASDLDNANSNNFQDTGRGLKEDGTINPAFAPGSWEYDFHTDLANETRSAKADNVYVVDLSQFQVGNVTFAPQHMGHVYANLLATLNLASQDIYKTTHRGPGSWILTSPLVGAMLESAAKLEGGIASGDKPTNMGNTSIEYKGKFAGKYDLYIDPLYPEDEILMGYKGANAMDAGYVYCPYIPLQQLPTVTDPESFQPRKGILTRYGKAAVTPASQFYRIIRIVGGDINYLLTPFVQSSQINGATS